MFGTLRHSIGLALLLGASAAHASTFDETTARTRLVQFEIVRADMPEEAYAGPYTRAQLFGVLVAGLGLRDEAELARGSTSFVDVDPNAWYSGVFAIASSLGIAIGDPSGQIFPLQQVTLAETLALLFRTVGMPQDPDHGWPENYLVPALSAGLLSPEQADEIRATFNSPSPLGVGLGLVDQVFYRAPYQGAETVYQTFWSTTAPTLELSVPAEAGRLETTLPTFRGFAAAGAPHVFPLALRFWVDGREAGQATLVADGEWAFTVDRSLPPGWHEVRAELVDFAGRRSHPAVRTFEIASDFVEVSPTTLGFSDQAAGTSSEPALVTIWNRSPRTATVTGVEIAASFELVSGPYGCTAGLELPEDAWCFLSVVFAPAAEGTHAGDLVIVVADREPVVVPVLGTATPGVPIAPDPDHPVDPTDIREADEETAFSFGCAQAGGGSATGLVALLALVLFRRRR